MKIKPFLVIACIWLVFGGLHLLSTYLDQVKFSRFDSSVFTLQILYYLSAYSSWSIVCYLTFVASQYVTRNNKYAFIPIQFFIGVTIWLPIFFVIDMKIGSLLGLVPEKSIATILQETNYQLIFFYTVVYSLMFGLCLAVSLYDYSRRVVIEKLKVEKLEAQNRSRLSELQIKALQSHLSPHFLFNSLGSISALARQSNKEAVTSAVAHLGDLLRFSINANKKTVISISEELQFVENYISLQKIRFENRFTFSLDKGLSDDGFECPPFTLQILVENAFVHGVSNSQDIIDISVAITEKKESIYFSVSNTVSPSQNSNDSFGSGLSNLHERLEMIYAGQANINTYLERNTYTASVKIPKGETDE